MPINKNIYNILKSVQQSTDPTTEAILAKLQAYGNTGAEEYLNAARHMWMRAGRPRTNAFWRALDEVLLNSDNLIINDVVDNLAEFETSVLMKTRPLPAWIGVWVTVEDYIDIENNVEDAKVIKDVLKAAMTRYLSDTE